MYDDTLYLIHTADMARPSRRVGVGGVNTHLGNRDTLHSSYAVQPITVRLLS